MLRLLNKKYSIARSDYSLKRVKNVLENLYKMFFYEYKDGNISIMNLKTVLRLLKFSSIKVNKMIIIGIKNTEI